MIIGTFFFHKAARHKQEFAHTPDALVRLVETHHKERKEDLQWIKLARFGDHTTDKESLRNNQNVLAITGIEADYDGERIAFDTAVEILEEAGIEAITYTSPSHSESKPRWRILAPLSREHEPQARERFLARLNGLFQGAIGAESFTLSQSYYFGYVGNDVPASHRAKYIAGQFIDTREDLDAGAIGRYGTPPNGSAGAKERGPAAAGQFNIQAAIAEIISGGDFHPTIRSLAASMAARGMERSLLTTLMVSLFNQAAAARPDLKGRDKEVHQIVAWVYQQEAKKAKQPSTPWIWEGSVMPEEARKWLVENLLPETGVALLSGQWGSFKTFIALDLAAAVMTGTSFIHFPTSRRGGTLLLACEGQNEVAIRIRAAYEAHGGKDRAPFAWQESAPRLLDPKAEETLVHMVNEAAMDMQRRFSLPTTLIIIDTVGKAAGYTKAGDENDSAVAKIIMQTLTAIAAKTAACVLGITHFGKIAATGTRGSSAYEDDADTVLAALANRDMAGNVTNTRLSARKRRSGPAGEEYNFQTRKHPMGRDTAGNPLDTLTIQWTTTDAPQPAAALDPWAGKKSLGFLHLTLTNTLLDAGKPITPWPDGPTVRAVDLEILRTQFYLGYPAAEATSPKTKANARRQAFHRAITTAKNNSLISSWDIAGTTFIWMTTPIPKWAATSRKTLADLLRDEPADEGTPWT